VRLNRAIAVAELNGPQVALAEVDRLPLEGYHAVHGTRADLLRRLGRGEESRAAYDRAVGLAGNTAETAYLIRCRDQPPAREPHHLNHRLSRRPQQRQALDNPAAQVRRKACRCGRAGKRGTPPSGPQIRSPTA
jgi:hypothetical protein